ncbi:MAG: response regulator transcription factor [Chloroflexi bacterium]|nr:response regulator transcription factor [Chloroflexota bacterium]
MAKQPADWVVPLHPTPVILVVDDDPDFVEAVRMVLEREGYEVHSAASGQEALRAMAVTPPDLVILDIMMDGILDGWDASGRIRATPQLRHTPILVVSSITSSDYLSMFPTDEDHLIDNFLSKPVAPDALLAEVRRLLSRRRA